MSNGIDRYGKYPLTKQDVLDFSNINGYNLINKISDEEKTLTGDFLSFGMSENDFYKKVMFDYSKVISYLILHDYGNVLDSNTISKLKRFILTNESIVFLDKSDFPETSVNGKRPSAYARNEEGKVYFSSYDFNENIISFIRKQEQFLIHEMFHIVTKNNLALQDLVLGDHVVGKYKPGSLFNEALVEKSTRDFATRHNLMYHPVIEYIPYVRSLEMFMNKYGIQNNSQMFNINFNDVIKKATIEEQQQYYDFEKDYNLRRLGKSTEKLQEENLGYLNSTQFTTGKRKVKILNNGINNKGFTNIIILSVIVGLVLVGIMILIYRII